MTDPLQQMELEEKRRAVDADKRVEKAKEKLGEKVEKKMPQGVKGGKTLSLVLHPDELLHKTCEPVAEFDAELRELLQDMAYTMYLCGGVGLSGPQVGQLRRVFVADWSVKKEHPIFMVNPEVLEVSPKEELLTEGCLSFPAVRFPVKRPAAIRARWWTEHGKEVDLWLEGWAARIFLHECDHLDGKIFLDRVSALVRRQALKKGAKLRQNVKKDMKGNKQRQRRGWR
jgi:peptide deformylase